MAARGSNGLRRQRRISIRDLIVRIMRSAEPTPFAAEGPARAGVRGALCMAGWRWPMADAEAELLVRSALQMVGAKRPTWKEGQPEFTQPGALPIVREQCARCAMPLPEGHYKYCGPVCWKAAKIDWSRRWALEQQSIAETSGRAISPKCPSCRKPFFRKREEQKFCSTACAYDARRSGGRPVRMVCEAIRIN